MLVVFAIGWSSVSVASANTMHLVMPSEKTNPHCLDCGTMACQNLVTSLPITTPELSVPDHGYPEKTLLPAYHAQHLAGYWQEILPPPKA